jgi:hypothetical protein
MTFAEHSFHLQPIQPMNLPIQYSYNLRLPYLALGTGSGFALLAMIGLENGSWPHGLILCVGLLPIGLGLFAIVRGILFDSFLVMDKDALLVPTGLGRVRAKRIPYTSIERVWETHLPWTVVLNVATKEGKKFEVVSTMLPKASDYVDIGKFLYAQAGKAKS